jgi:hypothetical protein
MPHRKKAGSNTKFLNKKDIQDIHKAIVGMTVWWNTCSWSCWHESFGSKINISGNI